MPIIYLSKKEFIENNLVNDIRSSSSEDIPSCVILEIINSYTEMIPENISISAYITRINILSKTIIISPYSDSDYRILARFLNPSCHWNIDKLLLVFDFFQKCKNLNFRNKIPISSSTKIGLPSPDNPFSLSPCILYMMCKDIGCTTTNNFEIMDLYITYYQRWYSLKSLNSRIFDDNIYQQIDFNGVDDPKSEFQFVISNKYCGNNLLILYRLSDINISPYLFEYFNPEIHFDLYSKKSLNILAKNEGLTSLSSNKLDIYNQLKSQQSTFIHGKQTCIKQIETYCSLENVDEILYDDCVCYGRQGEIFSVYTYGELKDIFLKLRRFCIVNDHGYIDLEINQISKLRRICKKHGKTELIKVINEIRSFLNFQFEKCHYIYKLIESAENRKNVESCLLRLHELSMYMRGWKDGEKFPPGELDDTELIDIDVRVTIGFIRYYEQIEKSGEYGIGKLPLMRYENKTWRIATLVEEGLTIEERCIIIKTSNDMNSCIRISSNWLASTAWYYMYMIGMEVPYLIEDLKTLI